MSYQQGYADNPWEACFPSRAEYVDIVRAAARGTRLRPAIKRKLTLYAKATKMAVYGQDHWACGSCPLTAVGVKRSWAGAWEEDGAWDFMVRYDKAMRRRVGLASPCLVSVRDERAPDDQER